MLSDKELRAENARLRRAVATARWWFSALRDKRPRVLLDDELEELREAFPKALEAITRALRSPRKKGKAKG